MIRTVFDMVTCACEFTADAHIQNMVDEYLAAFRATNSKDRTDLSLSVRCDPASVTGTYRAMPATDLVEVRRSHPDQRYLAWRDGRTGVLVPENRSDHAITSRNDAVEVVASDSATAGRIAVRVLRQIIMRGGQACGGRNVHAAVVVHDGRGIVIGGMPGAGKTTVLTRLVEQHGARPVANDRAVLIPVPRGRWLAVGVPLAWRFTPEGLTGSARLTDRLVTMEPRRGRGLIDGKHEFTPAEISQLLGHAHRAATAVDEVVVVSRSVRAEGTSLRTQLDFGDDDFFADDWLGIRARLRPNPAWQHAQDADFWSRLDRDLPVRRFTWTDPSELPRLAAALAARGPA